MIKILEILGVDNIFLNVVKAMYHKPIRQYYTKREN